jgi:hypothetical protein
MRFAARQPDANPEAQRWANQQEAGLRADAKAQTQDLDICVANVVAKNARIYFGYEPGQSRSKNIRWAKCTPKAGRLFTTKDAQSFLPFNKQRWPLIQEILKLLTPNCTFDQYSAPSFL